MTATEPVTVPGVYDMPADLYHTDPVPGGSLSASGARRLLPPSCPALYRYERDNPPAPRKVFEEGHAAHRLVLGAGPELVRVDRDRWDTKEVKTQLAEIRERGAVPLKREQWQMVHAMAATIRAHPIAGALLAGPGRAEQSLFWVDGEGDVWRRARIDWLPEPRHGRLIIADYKTTRSAAPDDLPRILHEYGYAQQAAWYLDAVRACLHVDDPAFLLILQEKTPPYLVTVAEPDRDALRVGRALNREAVAVYRECVTTGRWPGYADDVVPVALPPWVEARYSQEVW